MLRICVKDDVFADDFVYQLSRAISSRNKLRVIGRTEFNSLEILGTENCYKNYDNYSL